MTFTSAPEASAGAGEGAGSRDAAVVGLDQGTAAGFAFPNAGEDFLTNGREALGMNVPLAPWLDGGRNAEQISEKLDVNFLNNRCCAWGNR